MSERSQLNERNQYYAYFTVVGDFDPAQITASIGVEPSEAWQKGDRNERTHMERKFSRWSLYSRLSRSESLEKQIEDVVIQLQPLAINVRSVLEQHDGGIQVVGYFHDAYPGMHLESQLLLDVGSLKLSLDFDFYYIYSDKREDS